MLKVIKAVKRSRSLMGVHLSGNEGMSKAFIAKGVNLIEATHEERRNINFRDIMEENDKITGKCNETKE